MDYSILQSNAEAGALGAFLIIYFLFLALGLVLFIMSIVATVQAHKAGREGWWVYLIFVFTVPIVGVIMWFFFGKKKPIMNNGRPFM